VKLKTSTEHLAAGGWSNGVQTRRRGLRGCTCAAPCVCAAPWGLLASPPASSPML